MQVKIKDLSAEIELKNTGMELEIRGPQGDFIGDLVITKSAVIWCEGKTKRANGIEVKMGAFLDLMRAQSPAAKKAAKEAAKKAPAVKKAAPANNAAPAKKAARVKKIELAK